MKGKREEADSLSAMRRFARPIKDGSREPDPLLCRHLRAKAWYVPDPHAERDVSRSSSTAQYWCLKTMRPDGPDGALALPEDCTDERVCFEAAVPGAGDS